MIEVTQEQVREVLNRLRWHAQYFWHGEKARELLAETILEHNGKHFSISVCDDGQYEMHVKETDKKFRFEARALTAPPQTKESISNLEYGVKLVNEEWTPEEKEWLDGAAIFICSTFQRTCAFNFFANIQEVSIEYLTVQLASLKPKNS